MPIVKRDEVVVPVLPRETVPVPELKGEVVVRGLLLVERLENDALHRLDAKPRDGEAPEAANARAGAIGVPRQLSRCVVDEEDQPLMSVEQWVQWGSVYPLAALRLFNIAMRLSGMGTGVEKALEKN